MLICALPGTTLNTQGGMKQDLHCLANPKKQLMWKIYHQMQKLCPVWIYHMLSNSGWLLKLLICITVVPQT